MQKISLILFLFILFMGCSVTRNGSSKNYGWSNEILSEKIIESIKKQNITSNSFYIQKAEIDISTQNGREKVIGSIKFESPDKYLISIKSRSGIEGTRIFISNDTILVNDRINRKQYFGSPEYLQRKFGVTLSILPVILGDYIMDNLVDNNQTKCLDGKLYIDCISGGIKIKYVIDCKKGKTILAISENRLNYGGIEIQYNDFLKVGEILTPGKIEIHDNLRMTKIEIRIRKIESPWNGNIEFIPGNKYELIQLL